MWRTGGLNGGITPDSSCSLDSGERSVDQQIELLHQMVGELSKSYGTVTQLVTAHEAKMQQLQAHHQQIESRLEERLVVSETRMSELQHHNDRLVQEVEELEKRLVGSETRMSEFQDRNDRLVQEVACSDAQIRDLKEHCEMLSEHRQGGEARLQRLFCSLEERLQESETRHERDMVDLRAELHEEITQEAATTCRESLEAIRQVASRLTRGLEQPLASTPRVEASCGLPQQTTSSQSPELISALSLNETPAAGELHRQAIPDQVQSSAPSPVKVNRNNTTLPTFAGKQGESLQSFLNKVENGARLGNWTPAYKMGQLYAQLTGAALQYVDSLPQEEGLSYDALCAALRQRYEGELEREKCREFLRTCTRGRNESLEELQRRITELARKACTPDRREEESLYALRHAVSETLAHQLVLQRYATMDEAVMALQRLECHVDQRNRSRQAKILQEEKNPVPKAAPAKESAPAAQPVRAIKDPKAQAQEQVTLMAEALGAALKPLVGRLDSLDQLLGRQFQVGPRYGSRRKSPTRGKRGGPSEDRPCAECGSPEHWVADCPDAQGKRSGKDQGLDHGSRGQPHH